MAGAVTASRTATAPAPAFNALNLLSYSHETKRGGFDGHPVVYFQS